MNENVKLKGKSFTVNDFMNIVIERWRVIAVVCAVCVVALIVLTVAFIQPMYLSTAKLYIKDKTTSIINANEISVSSYLTKDYEEIVVDRSILEQVISELSLPISAPALKSRIATNNPENTRFLEIGVLYSNPETAKQIVDKICEVTQERIVETMDIDRVIIFSEGNLARSPSSPRLFNNILIGLLIGVAISFVYVLIIYFKDDKINGEGDVEKYLELTVLGFVPFTEKNNRGGKKKALERK